MKKILFVDDEILVLQGLKRSLRSMREVWEMSFEDDPEKALGRIKEESFDVIVSDMRMPKISGIDVLKACREHCPRAVRIGLSGYADSDMQFQAASVAHQYFAKPCEPSQLVQSIDSITRLQERVSNPELLEVVQSLTSIPSLPTLYTEVTMEAAREGGSLARVGEIIAQDVGMTSKVLQLVNSAHFGLTSEISSPAEAATALGIDTLRTLIVSAQVFSAFEEVCDQQEYTALWDHCLAVSEIAPNVAEQLGLDRKSIDQARLAGMLHDIGQLLILSELPHATNPIKTLVGSGMVTRTSAEQDLLGCSHADLGAYTLTLWGFYLPVVEAVAYHHNPIEACNRSVTPLSAVHIANAIANTGQANADAELDRGYLESIGITETTTEACLQLRSTPG